jgi:type VI secretion system protein ImpK
MLERSQNSYPLLREFREFYGEVARLKRMAVETREADAPTPGTPAAALAVGLAEAGPDTPWSEGTSVAVETADATTSRVWYEMTRYLDQKRYQVKAAASSFSPDILDILDQLLYIMAAYADETFICLVEWSGKDYWSDNLVELRLFRSQIAGQEIFRRIDRLLARHDYGTEEMVAIYLMILALGFKGQYLRDPASIEVYRRRLFDRLLLTNPDLRWNGRRIFPEAYRHTVTEGAPVKLPEPKKWWGAVAAIVGGWLILSTIAWLVLVSPTRKDLAVVRQALAIVTNRHSTADTSTKWRALPFALQSDAFQLELPPVLPMNRTAAAGMGTSVAPLLIAVDTPGGKGAASRINEWLSSGLSSFPRNLYNAAPQTKSVASVQQVPTPGSVTAADETTFFLVDPDLNAQDLALHPTLTFPSSGKSGATAVTLYLGDQSPVVAQ